MHKAFEQAHEDENEPETGQEYASNFYSAGNISFVRSTHGRLIDFKLNEHSAGAYLKALQDGRADGYTDLESMTNLFLSMHCVTADTDALTTSGYSGFDI